MIALQLPRVLVNRHAVHFTHADASKAGGESGGAAPDVQKGGQGGAQLNNKDAAGKETQSDKDKANKGKGYSKNRFPPRGTGGGSTGAERTPGREGITVVSAFEGYAFDAGIRAGDRITAINGQRVAGISVDKVICTCISYRLAQKT